MNFNKTLTTTEAAERLNLSPMHIRFLIAHNKIKAVKKGRQWFVCQKSADAYKKRHSNS